MFHLHQRPFQADAQLAVTQVMERLGEVAMKDGYVRVTEAASRHAKTTENLEIHQPEEHAGKDICVE